MAHRLRWRLRLVLAACIGLCLVALAAVSEMLIAQVGALAGRALGNPLLSAPILIEQLRAQVSAAQGLLWLAAAAVAVLTIALSWVAMQMVVLRRIEAASRDVVESGEAKPTAGHHELDSGQDELDSLIATIAAYRGQLAADRGERAAQLETVGALQGAAEAIAAQLQQADRLALVGRVAMGMAHEIGGPLAIVVGFLERLETLERADAPLEQRMRCVDQARHAADRIHALLGDMAQPGLPLSRDVDRPCDLASVAVRVAAQAEQHPAAARLQIGVTAADQQHQCDASASHMEQVLLNLIVNAADALHGQGRVELTLQRQGDWQLAHVDDDGPGIALADRERIFDEFYSTKGQALGQATRRSGWGLGLAVSRRIVARYGGTLCATDGALGGARMTLSVPIPSPLRRAARQSGVRSTA
ncbi:MAG: HAMP domain-containing histidine kinase [Myxococcales bacterium]|nr:HAMP domain-containing histidine kinase [Myxococcales bacterium]